MVIRRVPAALGWILAALAGCGGGTLRGPDAGRSGGLDAGAADGGAPAPDAFRRTSDAGLRPADPPGDDTIDLVVSWARLALEEPAGSGIVPGFDLDGFATARHGATGCGHPDFVAPAFQGGGDGIDNQLVPLYDAVRSVSPEVDLDQDLGNALASGDAIVLLRLAHVGDLSNDGEVEVSILTGTLVGGGAPRMVTRTVDGVPQQVIAPDQRFRIDAASLVGGRPVIVFDDAYIFDGRLVTRGTTFSLRVPATMGREFVLELRDVRVDARVSRDGLERGVLGGYALQEDLARGVSSALSPDDPVSPELVSSVLATYADIDLDGDGDCEGVSAALRLEATRAVLVDPVP
jgi:hypothetical protein